MTELLTIKETAKYLKISPLSLNYWRTTKSVDLPFYKIGGAVRYKKTDVEKFIEDNRK